MRTELLARRDSSGLSLELEQPISAITISCTLILVGKGLLKEPGEGGNWVSLGRDVGEISVIYREKP